MDTPIELLGLCAALVALAATVLLILGLRARSQLGARIRRLEDALRVYNSANAEIGRQMRAMEERLLMAATAPLPQRLPEAAVPRASESARVLAARPPVLAPRGEPEDGGAGDGAAERRLAELIRARLPVSRALQ